VNKIRKRLTYANVMSSIAVFLVLGGATAFAASSLGRNSVGTKQLKRNSVTAAKIKKNAVTTAKLKNGAITGAKVKDQSLTGSDINLGTLGKVPSAASADNATNLTGFKVFSGRGANESVTTLLSTGQFEVVGLCDPAGTLNAPGFDNGYNTGGGEAIGIRNTGQDNGWADTTDDDDIVFNVGEGVAFDYEDVNDGGSAVLPNGHWIEVLGGAVTNAADNPNFGAGCSFHGLAWFG
jgi:hypothetical protein